MVNELVVGLWTKLIGASGGSVVALAIIKPANWRDFLSRLVVSLIAGYMSAESIMNFMGWEGESNLLTAAGIGGMVGYSVLGLILRTISNWQDVGDAALAINDAKNKLGGKK